MVKPEWGTKRICQSCGAKFYDFSRTPIVCPSCETELDLETVSKARRPRAAPKPQAAPKPKKQPERKEPAAEDEALEVEDEVAGVDESDDAFIEEDDDLDEEGISKVGDSDEDEET